MPEYSPATASVVHMMNNLVIFEEPSVGGIRVFQDLIREEKLRGESRLRFRHAHILMSRFGEGKQ